MKAGVYLNALDALPVRPLADLARGRGIVVVAPHPDDESLGCGGLVATARESGIAVRVIVVSDGAGSHPGSLAFPPARLRALREAETLAAVAELGVAPADVAFLGLPDRFVPRDGERAQLAADAISAHAYDIDAGVVVVTSSLDPHCDHQAVHAIACRAVASLENVRIFAYPIWAKALAPDVEVDAQPPTGMRLDISIHLAAKRRAIAAHRSQADDLIGDDPNGFRLTPVMIAAFLKPFESFVWVPV